MIFIKKYSHTDDVSTLSIDIGVHNRVYKESWVKSVKASKLFVHENFQTLSFVSYINDIALLKLSEPINLDNKYYKCTNGHTCNASWLYRPWVKQWEIKRSRQRGEINFFLNLKFFI